MDNMATDLQASLRTTLGGTDEIHSIVVVRQADGNKVIVLYTWEDLSP